MTNDLELAKYVSKVRELSRTLNHLQANLPHTEMQLFMTLSDIERASNKAQQRLNDLMYGKDYKPVELMGT